MAIKDELLIATKTVLKEVSSGTPISPFELVSFLNAQSNLAINKKNELPAWQARFGQIQLGEEHNLLVPMYGLELNPEHWTRYPTEIAGTVAMVHWRNSQLADVDQAKSNEKVIPDNLGFLTETAQDPHRLQDFVALGLYAIRRKSSFEMPDLPVKTYHDAVRAAILRIEEHPETPAGQIAGTLNTILESTLFKKAGLEIKKEE